MDTTTTATPAVELRTGQIVHGFVVRRVEPLPHLRAVAYELEHGSTAARVLHVHSADTENLFSVTFPTPPADDTGLPHILEHAVLGGSRKFPVKDPFFEMVKSSMATFINAMTDVDKTMYPVDSTVRQDFFNLADVYFDAVFHPTLTENTFKREGYRLEPVDRANPAGGLHIKGIVYNEMKGAYSSADRLVSKHSTSPLFPDTVYGRDSGGDPDRIPDLTYEQFRAFHRTHYHPSNAYFFMYGDIPTADHLAFLKPRLAGFGRMAVENAVRRQERWAAPRSATEQYPVAPAATTAAKTFLTLNWLVCDCTDVQTVMALIALDAILLGNQAAPLRKALVDSKLGEDVTLAGFRMVGREGTFNVGLKGSEADRRAAFVALVLETLGRLAAEGGIEAERVDAAFQQLAYRYLEITSNFPLNLMYAATGMWIYGADPLALLRAEEHMAALKERFRSNPRLFGDLIRTLLLENPHRLDVAVVPDPQYQARKDAALAEEMTRKAAALSAEAIGQLGADADELERELNAPNTPEALASLPQLRVADLPRVPRHVPTFVEPLDNGVEVLRNDVFANGVNYVHLAIDLAGMPADLWAYLPLYGDCVRKMGAAGLDYVGMAERLSAHTGGVGFGPRCHTHGADAGRVMREAIFTVKFLDEKAAPAMGVLHDLLFALDLRDAGRLEDLLTQARAAHRTRVVTNGVGIAMSHAARGFNPESHLNEVLYGLPQTRLVESLHGGGGGGAGAAREGLVAKLEAIRDFMLARARLTASFTGSAGAYGAVRKTLAAWTAAMRGDAVPAVDDAVAFERWAGAGPREGLAGPMNVAFNTRVMPAPHLSHPDAPALTVAGRLVGLDYLLTEVRFKGTAYGAGCGYGPLDRTLKFHSYRDPWVTRTLGVFEGVPEYVRTAAWSEAEVGRAIIGTAKEGERPIRPAEATGTALFRHRIGDTPERRNARHAALLQVTPGEARRAMLAVLDEGMAKSAVCVVSSREKLEAANAETPGAGLSVEEIMA